MPSAVPSLTYPNGGCSDAISLYLSLLPNAELVEKVEAPDGSGIVMAKLTIGELLVYMMDGNVGGNVHDWEFTPGVSLLVEVGDDDSVVRIHDAFINDGGSTLMEPSDMIPAFGKHTFLADRFGMHWQLVAHGI